MPKIEVNEELFYALAGRRWKTREELEEALTGAKAELDEAGDTALPQAERTLKIELNDTNRPDLWGTAGCARQIRLLQGGKRPYYPFFSAPGDMKAANRRIIAEASVQKARPFIAGFVAKGRAVTDASLRDLIQTQEKLAWNYGRRRRTVSMGVYRTALIAWPVRYRAVDPGSVSFVPLQWDGPLTLRDILRLHPKGREYAFILEGEPLHPLLVDASGAALSYPPVINSADLGAVEPGDTELFVELTGRDIQAVTLSASIVACDLADQGFEIEPVEVRSEYDTPFGRVYTTPFYFQEPVFCALSRVERFLGERLGGKECVAALERVGCAAEKTSGLERGAAAGAAAEEGVRVMPPEYRNDYLHAADVVEDIMIGRGIKTFGAQKPRAFTVGRLSPLTLFSRRIKALLIGMGYQEMIYNYLGSRGDLIDNMRGSGGRIARVANPMSEKYEYVRDSVLANLMRTERVSARAAYPHKIFEIGKVVYKDGKRNYGAATRQYAGFLYAAADADFNAIAAQIQTMFYYVNRPYRVGESADPRFIPGRAADIFYQDRRAGVFGEIHPAVLEAFNVEVPCAACEFDVDEFLHSDPPARPA